MTELTWGHPALTLTLSTAPDLPVSLTSATADGVRLASPEPVGLVQILTAAAGHALASTRVGMTALGERLRYVGHEATTDGSWHRLSLTVETSGLRADVRLASPDGVAAFSSEVTVTNTGQVPVCLRSVASWAAPLGVGDPTGWAFHSAASDWLAESRWGSRPFRPDLFPGIAAHLTGVRPRGAATLTSHGTWSSGEHAPVAAATSATEGAAWLWQVEHNGPWRIEVGEEYEDFSVALSGPTDLDHAWSLDLRPGGSFTSVKAGVALGATLDDAAAAMTRYRRAARRAHPDNERLPVCFNDYMNTLNGDPTTAKLLPLVDAAAEAGAEVFCVDAGWYDDSGHWWDSVGEWLPSATRFPGGLGEVIDRIHERGMTPGLWLEPEVIGVRSAMAARLPDEAFLQRHGQRLVEQDRHHLDLRHPAARAHLDGVVDRLVRDFGVGFFKLDYNINPGSGTDHAAPSPGHGLLEHSRAVLAWLDGVLDRHPGLILENCGSGGMRADFAMLSRLQLQSTSDQQDFRLYPPIAASAPLQMLPEQAASWAYPQPGMDPEEIAFCLVTGLVGRIYLSGYLNRMAPSELGLVREAVAAAKRLRADLPHAVPCWPLGLPGWTDPWVALGLRTGDDVLVALWKRAEAGPAALPFPGLAGRAMTVVLEFPGEADGWDLSWDAGTGTLRADTAMTTTARLIRLTPTDGRG
ncbi:glycoside hydrolase family 36 protein [Tessaracoccus sp. G1721]